MELTQVKNLKLNVTNINSFLKKSNKDYVAIKKNNKRLVSDQNKIKKTKEKEKTIEKKSVGGSALSNVKDIAKSSAGIFDKILSFGGILLSGILLNALPSIKKKVDKFVKDNKELFDMIGGFLTGVKDAAVELFNSFTGSESEKGAFDGFAKFGDDGKLLPAPDGGALSEFVKVISDLAPIVEKINNATKNPIVRALEKSGFIPKRSLMDRTKEFVTGTGPGQLDNYGSDDTAIAASSSLGSGNATLNSLTDQQFSDLAYAVSGEAQPNSDDEYGVAANILTRFADPRYPNTIMGVFTAPGQYAAYEDGGARRDPQLAAKLKANKNKIAEAIQRLNGRTDFKGTSQYGNMGPGDIKFSDRGNFYHYASQRGKNDPPPSNPPTYWKKLITPKQKALKVSSNTTTSKNNQIASLNTSVGEEGTITYIYAVQPIIT